MLAAEALRTIVVGIALGFSIAAPPGPINATIASQVANRSWAAGFLVGLGALTADAIFSVATYYGLARAAMSNIVGSALFTLGGAMMLFLSYSTVRHARSGVQGRPTVRTRLPYLLGLSIGITNPFQIGWWVTVGFGVLAVFGPRILLGFFTGIVIWVVGYASVLSWAVAKYDRAYRYLNYASAAIMAGFGVWFLYSVAVSIP